MTAAEEEHGAADAPSSPSAGAAHAGAPSPARFVTLGLFFANSLLFSGAWICFAPVANLAAGAPAPHPHTHYGHTHDNIHSRSTHLPPLPAERFGLANAGSLNAASMAYFAAYVPGTAISMTVLDAYGVRACLLLSSALCTATVAARYAALALPGLSPHAAYGVNSAAYILAGLSQPMVLNVPSRMTMDWFPTAERDMATTVATMASVSGQMLFSLLPPWLVRTPAALPRILLVLLLPSAGVTAATALRLRERPSAPPSAAAAAVWRERAADAAKARAHSGFGGAGAIVVRDIRHLLALRNFNLLAAGFSIGVGTVWAVLILQSELLTPCGYSDGLAGVAATSLVFSGLLASAAMGAAMRATRAYLQLQRGIMVAAVLTTLGVLAAARPGNPAAVVATWAALGATLPPLVPLTLEHAAEMTFPISADASNAALIVGATGFSFLLTLGLTPLLRLPASASCTTVATPAGALIIACMVTGLGLTLGVTKDYRRSAYERDGGGAAREGGPAREAAAEIGLPLRSRAPAGSGVLLATAHESDSLLARHVQTHRPGGYDAML
jgi:hypothetical protein